MKTSTKKSIILTALFLIGFTAFLGMAGDMHEASLTCFVLTKLTCATALAVTAIAGHYVNKNLY